MSGEDPDALFDLGELFGQKKVNHGDPHHAFLYQPPASSSSSASPIRVHLPDSSVTLMAQYVWQSSISLADMLATGEIHVAQQSIVELGAGSALPSIVAATARAGPRRVVVTDYPEDAIVDTMKRNVEENVPADARRSVHVVGFKWGESIEALVEANGGRRFDVIIMADTLWLEEEHAALGEDDGDDGGC